MTAFKAFDGQPLIGFDMGGTSTDVSRYAGKYEHVFETTTAGITIQAPQVWCSLEKILFNFSLNWPKVFKDFFVIL